MRISPGSFVTCILAALVLIVYLFFIIYVKKDILYEGMKFTFVVIILILFRMIVPFNFPFTITIPFTAVLPSISRFLFRNIGDTQIRFADILIVIWIVEALRRLLNMFRKNRNYRRYLSAFQIKDFSKYPEIKDILEEYNLISLPVCVVPVSVSPEIFGVIKPLLILPEYGLEQKELCFACRHEIEHYKNHDLWLKLFVDLVVCVQWFNPLVYLLQNELILAFEMSNDRKVLCGCDENQRLDYVLSIIKVSKMLKKDSIEQKGLSFVKLRDINTKRRIHFITEKEYGKTKRRGLSVFIRYIIVVAMLMVSFVFVPDAWGIDEQARTETFGFDQEMYIVKTKTEYKLYVDDEYVFSLSTIPEEFNDIPVIAEEDLK